MIRIDKIPRLWALPPPPQHKSSFTNFGPVLHQKLATGLDIVEWTGRSYLNPIHTIKLYPFRHLASLTTSLCRTFVTNDETLGKK